MHSRRTTPLAAAPALALALTLWASAAAAQSLVISNLVVDNQAGNFTARFGVAVDGVAEVAEALKSGATMSLSCKARLKGRGTLIGSGQIAAAELASRLKYDALAKEYVLVLPGREAPARSPRLEDALRAGWSELALELGSWRMLERGQEYTLTLDIRLHQVDVPNWFKRLLFFWSWDVAPATSYQLHFKH